MNLSTTRLFVRDLTSAHDFYAGKLDLALVAGGPGAGFCVYAAGPCQLVVEPVAPEAAEEDQRLVGRFTGLSFAVADLAARHEELLRRGVVFSAAPELQAWGGMLATFVDPAGNALQLVQYPEPA
jgi:catechol 2,3-dioxygenase-like lactoylglutathione lyase family enzyme